MKHTTTTTALVTLIAACVPSLPPGFTESGDASTSTDTGVDADSTGADSSDLPDDGDGDGDDDGDGEPGDGDGDGDGDPECIEPYSWAQIECIASLCIGRLTCASNWVRVVHDSDLDIELQTGLVGPCFPTGFSAMRCIQAGLAVRCFAGDGEWFTPFTCGTDPGVLGWPAWMCGEAMPITVAPWESAGCRDEVATSCVAKIGDAGFEIWPDCYIQSLLP